MQSIPHSSGKGLLQTTLPFLFITDVHANRDKAMNFPESDLISLQEESTIDFVMEDNKGNHQHTIILLLPQ